MMKKLLILSIALSVTAMLDAKITLPPVIGDNMVLQQQLPLPFSVKRSLGKQ